MKNLTRSLIASATVLMTLLSASAVFAATPVQASAKTGWYPGSPLYGQLQTALDGMVNDGVITQAQENDIAAEYIPAVPAVTATTAAVTADTAKTGWYPGSSLYIQLKAALDGMVNDGIITQAQENNIVAEYIPAVK